MDVDAAYDAMIAAIKIDDWNSAKEYAEAIHDWVARGGFKPTGDRDVYYVDRVLAYQPIG